MVCPPDIRQRLERISPDEWNRIEEIRLRVGQPVQLCGAGLDRFLPSDEGVRSDGTEELRVTGEHIDRVLQAVTQSSLYAVEEDVRRGFVTMPGGHRVGVSGRVVVGDGGSVKSMRKVSSVNIRIARERIHAAKQVLPYTWNRMTGRPLSVLLVSPPQCGKTTLLRDMVRAWSRGEVNVRAGPAKVSVIDERSEIAGFVEGLPQFDIGPRTDVLDGCPKAEGMSMAIRSLSPDVVVTDEIGRRDDVEAILEATQSGVAVFATAHANSVDEWQRRPSMSALVQARAFDRYVVLSRTLGPGTLELVEDSGRQNLYRRSRSTETERWS